MQSSSGPTAGDKEPMRRPTTAAMEQLVPFELIGEDFEGCPHFWSKKKVKQYFLGSCRESGGVQNPEMGAPQLRAKH